MFLDRFLGEALGITEDHWAWIFRLNSPSVGRTEDAPGCKMVWGKQEDMS